MVRCQRHDPTDPFDTSFKVYASGRLKGAISVDHRTHHATKEIPACFATGEAAGLGAAMALQRGQSLAALDVPALRAALVKAGAFLD